MAIPVCQSTIRMQSSATQSTNAMNESDFVRLPRGALVIGASGRIGRELCRRLRESGSTVFGAARFSDTAVRDELEGIGVQTQVYEVRTGDPAALPDVDVVFLELWDPSEHAAEDAREKIWSLNYTAIGRIAARYAGYADIVNGCSGNVYGTHPEPRKEEDLQRPNDEYGLARFAQEKLIDFLCDEAGSRVVHLRYYHANGPEGGLIRRMAEAIRDGRSLGGGPDERVQVIAMHDFVRCTLLAASRLDRMPRAVNVCHPRLWTRRELAERIRESLGCGKVIFDADSGGRENSTTGNPTRMLEYFGEPERDIEEVIDAVCEACTPR